VKNYFDETGHEVLYSKRTKNIDPFFEIGFELFFYMVIQCRGCHTISFLLRESIDDLDENGKIIFIDSHYPDSSTNIINHYNFLNSEDIYLLPKKLISLYEEVQQAFKNESNVLAGIGIRTLVESICIHQKMIGRNLQDKIKNLLAAGLISSSELPILDKLRIIGNQSTHEIKPFSLDKLNYALDIVNHILKSIYILPKLNRKLKI
jgi:hypothetical protein